jgi:hypothetical protein
MSSDRIQELEQQIADLNRRWPAHSPPPSMLERLEELEAELERELKKANVEQEDAKADGGGDAPRAGTAL